MCSRPIRPPGNGWRSRTVTVRPRPASCSAADSPARPAPTTTTRSDLPPTVRISCRLLLSRLSCRALRAYRRHVDQCRPHRLVEPGAVETFHCVRQPAVDHLLDPLHRAGGGDESAPAGDVTVGEVALIHQIGQLAPGRGISEP